MELGLDLERLDLEKMAEELRCSVSYLRSQLGLPCLAVCEANTLKEARKAWENAPGDSEEERAALLRWRELSAEEIEKANTLEEAKRAWESAPACTEEERAALMKWISLCKGMEEVREAWRNAPVDAKERRAVLLTIATFFMKE